MVICTMDLLYRFMGLVTMYPEQNKLMGSSGSVTCGDEIVCPSAFFILHFRSNQSSAYEVDIICQLFQIYLGVFDIWIAIPTAYFDAN